MDFFKLMYQTNAYGLQQQTTARAKLIPIFFLGFSSGLPFLLILSTLSVWLAESGISKTNIGMFAWVTVPYTFKFLLASLIDLFKIPILHNWLGQRRSWMLLSQISLIFALMFLGSMKPTQNIILTAIAAFVVGLFSAIQDIVVEAYRIEILDRPKLGVGASASVLGYRAGMLCSGAGAIYLAAFFASWAIAYNIMAIFMLVGIVTTLYVEEPVRAVFDKEIPKKAVDAFLTIPRWWIIVLFIIFYKFSDTVLNTMSMPFLIEIGFNKIEIANVAKTFGISAMICGGIFGGVLLLRCDLQRVLFLAIMLQLLASLLFVFQAYIGYSLFFLFITMGVENFTCGLGQTVFITYLSRSCLSTKVALHYAILTSFASFVRVNFSMFAGWLADQCTWEIFYLLVCTSVVPTLMILGYCMQPRSYDMVTS